jgi:hypothetical protein
VTHWSIKLLLACERLCSVMVGWFLLSGFTTLTQAGQEKLRLLSLHHGRRGSPGRLHGPG